jgi:hypothetical protein
VEGREMIVCTKCCQEADRGETFCLGCGAFLEWFGEPVTPAEAPPRVVPAALPTRPASVEREIARLTAAWAAGCHPERSARSHTGRSPH